MSDEADQRRHWPKARFDLPNTLSMDRAAAYRSLLREALPNEDLQAIRDCLQQHTWGCDDFRAMVEAKTQRFAAYGPLIVPAAIRRRGK